MSSAQAYTAAKTPSSTCPRRAPTSTRHSTAHMSSVATTTAPDLLSHQYENETSYVSALTQFEQVYHTKNPTAIATVLARRPTVPFASLIPIPSRAHYRTERPPPHHPSRFRGKFARFGRHAHQAFAPFRVSSCAPSPS